ncbi:MAG: hemerythrin domain-containing protein [Deltaproteobacteria bacterium]|nr:hemerythrin domain-containing protein [Candidatus Deferrimicrobiaceae bacterium]
METFLKTPIKEVIGRYPPVGAILEEFGIGCVPCSVGTCLLSDVVEIHNLSPADEDDLMVRIASIVSPGQAVRRPDAGKDRTAKPRKLAYSPPMKRLVEEHRLILRFIAMVPEIAEGVDLESGRGREEILTAVDFIRCYADRFHHAKEEDILFACFDPGLDILKAMHEDHRQGRACVQGVLDALERGDTEGVVENLHAYGGILAGHIKKEDEILYPWMDRNLSTHQVGEIFARFREVDGRFREAQESYESYVEMLEKNNNAERVEVSR